jgi:hypothetical protein
VLIPTTLNVQLVFGPLGALESFFDCPRPDTAKINGCRCRVYARYLLSSIRDDDLHHHFFGSFFKVHGRLRAQNYQILNAITSAGMVPFYTFLTISTYYRTGTLNHKATVTYLFGFKGFASHCTLNFSSAFRSLLSICSHLTSCPQITPIYWTATIDICSDIQTPISTSEALKPPGNVFSNDSFFLDKIGREIKV